jgi:cell division protein FtsI/penicillin-binding protein 2
MRDCVVYGSCQRLGGLPFAVAGKTGTAQWNNNKPNHAWFTSFAPFNKPEIVVTILVEEGGEGSAISAPIAYEFYKWWWYHRKAVDN